ncbi:hypothetical protein [Polaribacter sp.]|uniref:hypothetical protein n=1 Tax=Polaribacter sp. TaxID=1920175 RepID=UPI003F6ABF5E
MITEKEIDFQKLKYFSHLDKNQKIKTINYLRILKNGLGYLPYKVGLKVLKYQDINRSKKEIESITKKLKAQKVFRDTKLKTYFPLNYKEILSKKKDCLNCGNKVKYLFCNLDCEKEYTNE